MYYLISHECTLYVTGLLSEGPMVGVGYYSTNYLTFLGTWRMCIDYGALNNITLKNRYPLPRINDLLDQLDLKLEYHQVRVKEECTWNISFKRRQGLYEWLVLLFGLCNTPATFMRLMNDVLCPYLDSFVIVYLDDILDYKSTWEEHISYLM
jgi:hypothetical protein